MAEQNLAQEWAERIEKLEIKKIDPFRPVTTEELQYLRDRFPYLRIINTAGTFSENKPPKIVSASSGWDIQVSPDIITASPGEQLFGNANYEKFLQQLLAAEDEDKDGGDADLLYTGTGTLIKQMVDTACAMVDIATLENKWPEINIVAGTNLMQWAAWMYAEEKQIKTYGFDPTEKDEAKRRRIAAIISSTIGKAPSLEI